jgi:membrane protein implicated in regulation of membrane protease activity
MGVPRLLLVFALATAGVVLLVITLATGSWWLLALVVLAHAIAFTIATGAVFATTSQQSKPDPVTAARLEEEHGGAHAERQEDDEPHMAI